MGLFGSQEREAQEGAGYSDHHWFFHVGHILSGLYANNETVVQELNIFYCYEP